MGLHDTFRTKVFALLAQTLSGMKANSPQHLNHHSTIKHKYTQSNEPQRTKAT
jgi:hypothetical protein